MKTVIPNSAPCCVVFSNENGVTSRPVAAWLADGDEVDNGFVGVPFIAGPFGLMTATRFPGHKFQYVTNGWEPDTETVRHLLERLEAEKRTSSK